METSHLRGGKAPSGQGALPTREHVRVATNQEPTKMANLRRIISVHSPICPYRVNAVNLHETLTTKLMRTHCHHTLLAATLLAVTLSPAQARHNARKHDADNGMLCLAVSTTPSVENIDGLGVELDPHFLSSNAAADIGVKEGDWDSIVVPRLRDLAFSKWRVMVLPSWYEPENDNGTPNENDLTRFTFQSPQMHGLYRQLDLAQQDGTPVCLVFWGVRPQTFMLPEQADGWVFGPSQYDEWAENISVCLQHLLNMGYTCIKEITPVNEPDWSFTEGSTSRAQRYAMMCKVLEQRLKDDGLREKVQFTLSDDSDGGTGRHTFLEDAVRNLPWADLFCSHTYLFGYDTPNDSILSWERTNVHLAARAGKRHFVGEFGSNQVVGATRQRDINRPERGVLMGRIVINLLNAGAAGASYWSLMDQYYSLSEAQEHRNMQQLGLWRHLRQEYLNDSTQDYIPSADYELRPQYHALRLLSHAVRRGCKVYPIDTRHPFLAATALQSPQGKWTYLLANPTDTTRTIVISNRQMPGRHKMHVQSYQCDALGKEKNQSQANVVKTYRKKTKLALPPRSLYRISEEKTSEHRPTK